MSIDTKTLRLAEATYRDRAHHATADLLRDAAGTIDAQAARIEARDIIVRSVAAALERHGVTEADDPGEAIDVLVAGKDAEIKRLRALVAELADHDTYETEYDGRMYTICNDCGAQDNAAHSPSCVYIRARAALQGESKC